MRASISWALAKDHAKTMQRMIPKIIVESASKRALDCRSSALRRKSLADIFNGSVGWFCQIFWGSLMGKSLGMNASFAEPASQNVLDAVDLHRDVGRR